MYKRTPCGEHLVSVCTNTLCAALGGDAIYNTLSAHLGVGHEGPPASPAAAGSITLETAECLAACDHGPVLQVNYEFYDNQTPRQRRRPDHRAAGRRDARTRPRCAPADFRSAERRSPASTTGRDDVDAPTAAAETLRGAELAEQTGHGPRRPCRSSRRSSRRCRRRSAA